MKWFIFIMLYLFLPQFLAAQNSEGRANNFVISSVIDNINTHIVFYHNVYQGKIDYQTEIRFEANVSCDMAYSIRSFKLYYRKKNESRWHANYMDSVRINEYLTTIANDYYTKEDTIEYYLKIELITFGNYGSKKKVLFHPVNATNYYYTFWFDSETSVLDNDSPSIQLYPNPSSDYITLKNLHYQKNILSGHSLTVSIINSCGEIFYQDKLLTAYSKNDELKIDISDLYPGHYYIMIVSDKKSICKLFTVLR